MADQKTVSSREHVICPHCGEQHGDCWEWVTDTVKTTTCDECGKRFEFWAEYDVTYRATAQIEEEAACPGG